jgi:hypothetical protein
MLLAPLAIWLPLFARFRGLRAVVIGAILFVAFGALLQIAPLGAPRTMRRRYRRLTAQADLIALAAFCLLALAVLLDVRRTFIALASLALDTPVVAFLLVSLPLYLAPHPEDVPRP